MGVDLLITRCIDRDPTAWGELLELHRPMILRVLVRAVGSLDPAVVTDLEQELYLRLLAHDCEALRGLRGAGAAALRGFLCTTALNLARDQRRRLGVRRVMVAGDLEALVGDLADPGETQDRTVERRERTRLVLEAVERVIKGPQAERDRLIFKAHFVDGLSASEVASMGVGLTQKGVETVIFRLVARVRDALRARTEDAA